MSAAPKISVILPVYNAEKYIREAIDSILNQTYRDFELIIINDGSSDGSRNIISGYTDKRIVFLEQSNIGLAATLNSGIDLARGEYIARQDNDDISLPPRLEKQLQFMEANKEIALCGTCAEIIDQNGQPTGRHHKHSSNPVHLKFALLFNNPFVHSSVFFRKEITGRVGNYNTDPGIFEDYNLWSRIARVVKISNLDECLLKYREVPSGMSKTSVDYDEKVKRQSIENISYYCDNISAEKLEMFETPAILYKKTGNYKEALIEYTGLMNVLTESFCKKEQIFISEIDELVQEQILNFRRRLYNSVIYSENESAVAKLKARISRKLMFIIYKNVLQK